MARPGWLGQGVERCQGFLKGPKPSAVDCAAVVETVTIPSVIPAKHGASQRPASGAGNKINLGFSPCGAAVDYFGNSTRLIGSDLAIFSDQNLAGRNFAVIGVNVRNVVKHLVSPFRLECWQ